MAGDARDNCRLKTNTRVVLQALGTQGGVRATTTVRVSSHGKGVVKAVRAVMRL